MDLRLSLVYQDKVNVKKKNMLCDHDIFHTRQRLHFFKNKTTVFACMEK